MIQRRVVAGIDVGGTKAHVLVEDADTGTVLRDVVLSSEDWTRLSTERRGQALAELARSQVVRVGDVAGLAAGVHGSDSPEQHAVFESALRQVCPGAIVTSDAELVVPAAGYDGGVGVIAGTGSSATSRRKDGSVVTVGGWGWLLGDDGGATGLVRDAARSVLFAYDSGQTDLMNDLLLNAFDIDHPALLGGYLAEHEPRRWAQAAHAVFTAALRGSPAASSVIARHVGALAELVATIARRGGRIDRVVAGGGVLRNQLGYFASFAEEVRRLLPDVQDVVRLDRAPVHGALRLARQTIEPPERNR